MTIAQLLPIIVAPFVACLLRLLIETLAGGTPVVCDRRSRLRGLLLRCRAAASVFPPAIVMASTAVALLAVILSDDPGRVWADCVLGWTLIALAWIDARHFRLPDALTLPLLLTGLVATWLVLPEALLDHTLATITGYLVFRLVAWGYRIWRGHDGLGMGDAKLLAAGGAWVGSNGLSAVVFVAAVLGLAWAFTLRMRGRRVDNRSMIPFGPPLAVAIWLVRSLDFFLLPYLWIAE